MRKTIKWIFIAGFLLFGFIAFIAAIAALTQNTVAKDSVLHVYLDGELRESPDPDIMAIFDDKPSFTLREFTDSVRRAATDDRIVGLVLDVRNPQVGFSQLADIEDAMAVFRKTGKWNAAFLETAGEVSRGNGIYALAACADTLYLAPPGDINLVGLGARIPFFKGVADKLKIGVQFDKRHEYKTAANQFTETKMTAAHRESTSTLVDELQSWLVSHIAARRKVDVTKALEWVKTGPHLATAAVELGLVDHLAYSDEVRDHLKEMTGRQEPLVPLQEYVENKPVVTGPTVALIYGDGQVMRGESSQGTMGSDTLALAFRQARKEKVAGVLFRVNSPGGSYVASDLIRREVQVTRNAGIPVVVSMGDMAASGGYFVAMEADHIVAQPGTLTGSIGVYAGRFNVKEFWNHWFGVSFDGYDTTDNAAFYSWLEEPGEVDQKRIDEFLDRVYEDFVSKAAAGRHMEHDALEKIARGRVWSGSAAKAHGLVDSIGDMDLALVELKKLLKTPADDVNIRVFPPPKTTFEVLTEAFTQTAHAAQTLRRGSQLVESIRAGREPGILSIPVGLQVH